MNLWKFQSHSAFVLFMCMILLQIKASSPMMIRTNETDKLALLAIKAQITSDPMRVTSSWNESLHFCQWQGVSCGKRHQRVTALDLHSLSLVGSISASIGNLSFIRTIRLSNNSFHGEIPHTIGLLYRLQGLNLQRNSLNGQIPVNLSLCSNLIMVRLSGNKFTGRIPPSLGNLSFLQEFGALANNIEGSIPDSLGQIKTLTYISLGHNNLSGTIPPSIYNLSLLTTLFLGENQLQGDLPKNLGLTLPNIEILVLYINYFSGSVPVSLSNASNLQLVDIWSNQFSGGLHINFQNLQNLSMLSLVDNNLGSAESGDINFLSSMTNCSKLTTLFLDENNFGGVLPNSIANFSTQFRVFSIYYNQISGSIPAGIGNLVGLESIDMESNKLTGSIPSSIGLLLKLHELGFGKNNLSGEIPFSIGNLTLLNKLWIEENNLQGSIPSSLGNCHNLIELHLYGNKLSGSIPREVIGLSSLSITLNLARNQLTGPLPSDVGNLRNLVILNISYNRLSGEIPSSIASCMSLRFIYMHHNSFGGTIPESLGSLNSSEEINLSHNNLSGEIPRFLSTIPSLRSLNLSFNNLEGEVPTRGVFENSTGFLVAGNGKLCGGIAALHLPICSIDKQKKKHNVSLVLELVVPLVCGVLGVSSSLIFCWFVIKRRRSRQFSLTFSLTDPFPNISYGQLLKGTGVFSPANLIGSGSFGSVYKAKLNPNEGAIAVKVLNLQNEGASKSFMAECEALKNIRHRNLVKILTTCSSIDYNGNDFKALVFEFMTNGSLETWLYPVTEREPKNLNLLQRLNIAIDVASALDYLHNQCEIPIIHCDLKPSNVLLDEDMTARVSDFGLAKLLRQDNSVTPENQTNSTSVKGTIGYVAPEYGMGSIISTCGDVYSFGIILLEMFVGKRPTDNLFVDSLNLHKLAAMALAERVMQFVDPNILLPRAEEEDEVRITNCSSRRRAKMESIEKGLTSIFNIGVACSQESPTERMKIVDVVAELKSIREMVIGNTIISSSKVSDT